MKKILAVVLAVVMMSVMMISVSAAATVQGMKIILEDNGDGTVAGQVIIGGTATGISGAVMYLKTTAITYVADSGSSLGGWTVTDGEKNDGIKITISADAKFNLSDEDKTILTFTANKADPDAKLVASDFAFGTGTLDVSKISCDASSSFATSKNPTSKTAGSAFAIEIKGDSDIVKGVVDDTAKTELSKAENTGDMFNVANGGMALTNNAYMVAVFGKAASDLSAKSYGVTFNGVTFYGLADVAAGANWVIKLVAPDGTDKDGNALSAAQESQFATFTE